MRLLIVHYCLSLACTGLVNVCPHTNPHYRGLVQADKIPRKPTDPEVYAAKLEKIACLKAPLKRKDGNKTSKPKNHANDNTHQRLVQLRQGIIKDDNDLERRRRHSLWENEKGLKSQYPVRSNAVRIRNWAPFPSLPFQNFHRIYSPAANHPRSCPYVSCGLKSVCK